MLAETVTMTLSEFLALPQPEQDGTHYELDEGELIRLSLTGSFNVELRRAVGTGGQFDDQRMGPQGNVLTGGFPHLPPFRDVSNCNVELFAQ